MSSNSSAASNNGIGIGTVLFCIFLVLKLTGTIAWSWWWVTAPLWIPALVVVLILGIVAVASLSSKGK